VLLAGLAVLIPVLFVHGRAHAPTHLRPPHISVGVLDEATLTGPLRIAVNATAHQLGNSAAVLPAALLLVLTALRVVGARRGRINRAQPVTLLASGRGPPRRP
jgi:hypothetical protein